MICLLTTLIPGSSLGTDATLKGKKRDKERITVVVTVNADGSEKYPPWIIGSAKNPAKSRKQHEKGRDLASAPFWERGVSRRFNVRMNKALESPKLPLPVTLKRAASPRSGAGVQLRPTRRP